MKDIEHTSATPPSADPGAEPLAAALRRLGDALDERAPPPALRIAVLARLAPVHGAPQVLLAAGEANARWAPWATAALCAALLVFATALLLRPAAVVGEPRLAADAATGSPFIPVAAAERWPTAATAMPSAPAWVVQAELPRQRLAEFGLPFDPTRAAEAVRAELLMRANGEVLAVRVIAPVSLR
jgi:hypothetical protein